MTRREGARIAGVLVASIVLACGAYFLRGGSVGRGGADLRQQDRCRALMHAAGAGTSPAGALSHNQPCLKALARLGFPKRSAPQELCLCSCLPGAGLDQTVAPGLPRELRVTWGALDCDAFWPHAAGARTVEAGGGAWREDTARGQDFCAKPCTDSWSCLLYTSDAADE